MMKSQSNCVSTPASPVSPAFINNTSNFYSEKSTMNKNGYKTSQRCFAKTLQGSVWNVIKNNKKYVIKVTKKSLHSQSVAVVNGNQYDIKEDIVKEATILRYLTCNNAPSSLAKYIDFFTDKFNYYLVMEHGGTSFFEFVVQCHKLINKGQLTINEWHRFVKITFKQMVNLMDWMHNTAHCAHLDISLENFIINQVMVRVNSKNQIVFCGEWQVKLCDFGVAEVFTEKKNETEMNFECNKFVGKMNYKSPKIGAKKPFDARLADCWSLGVCLFMMVTGGPAYHRPTTNDAAFNCIMKGKLLYLLQSWNKIDYVTLQLFDLMHRILKREKNRINIAEMKKHPWLL